MARITVEELATVTSNDQLAYTAYDLQENYDDMPEELYEAAEDDFERYEDEEYDGAYYEEDLNPQRRGTLLRRSGR